MVGCTAWRLSLFLSPDYGSGAVGVGCSRGIWSWRRRWSTRACSAPWRGGPRKTGWPKEKVRDEAEDAHHTGTMRDAENGNGRSTGGLTALLLARKWQKRMSGLGKYKLGVSRCEWCIHLHGCSHACVSVDAIAPSCTHRMMSKNLCVHTYKCACIHAYI